MKSKRAIFFCLLLLVWWTMGCRTTTQVQRPDPDPGPGPDESAPPQAAAASTMSIRGFLRYRDGAQGKAFSWNLRFYEHTGLVLGTGNDSDGYAEFLGVYSPRTKRFAMVKVFKRRSRGQRVFFYRGMIRGDSLVGSAHQRGFRGPAYAVWKGQVSFQKLKFDEGRFRRFVLRGSLRYRNGRSKPFLWVFRYYPGSGSCFGLVSDRDGKAAFSGVYDKPTNRFFLRKRYKNGNTYFYIGKMTRTGAVGNARRRSFFSNTVYAAWNAVMVRRQ